MYIDHGENVFYALLEKSSESNGMNCIWLGDINNFVFYPCP